MRQLRILLAGAVCSVLVGIFAHGAIVHAQVDSPDSKRCEITISAEVPKTVVDSDSVLDVEGEVSSNENCVGNITVNRTDDAGRTGRVIPPDIPPLVIPSGISRPFSFPGRSGEVLSIEIEGNVGLRGTYLYPSATVKASDECSASNQVTVYSCSETGGPGVSGYHIPESCDLSWFPDDRRRGLIEKYQKASSLTSPGGKTSLSAGPNPKVTHIVPGSIKIDFDPKYVIDTKKNRKFTPSKPYSLYDMLEISFELKTCAPAPDTLPFSVDVMTTDSSGKYEVVIASLDSAGTSYAAGDLPLPEGMNLDSLQKLRNFGHRKTQIVDDEIVHIRDRDVYHMKVPLIYAFNDNKSEVLIDSIANKRPVFLRISDGQNKRDLPIETTNCAQYFGSGKHPVVVMRGKNFITRGAELASITGKYVDEGFEKINPFKSYLESFSFFFDLTAHDDTKWSMLFGFFTGANNKPREISACGPNASQYFFHTSRLTNRAYAPYGTGIAFLPKIDAVVTIHEMAHSFAGLEDEYKTGFDVTLYYANCSPPGRAPNWGTVQRSKALGGDGFYYGDYFKGCQLSSQYRPSTMSIMNNTEFDGVASQFNVVSCGYILQAIKSGTASLRNFPMKNLIENWSECRKMSGIDYPLLNTADELKERATSNKTLAASISAIINPSKDEEDSMVSLDFNSPYITLESFSSDGTITGEVFEIKENKSIGERSGDKSNIRVTPVTVAGKPTIDALRAMVRDLQAQIQVLRDKIDAVKCQRGLAPCKNKILIPSKSLLPMENKKQQLGDVLETLKGLVQLIENRIR